MSTVGNDKAGHGGPAICLKFVNLFQAAVFIIYPLYCEHGLGDVGQVFPNVPPFKVWV